MTRRTPLSHAAYLLLICRLTAAVCAPSIPLTAGRARSARPEANVRCAWGLQRGVGVRGQRPRLAGYVKLPPTRRPGPGCADGANMAPACGSGG